jgi:hypothetical protein
MIEKTSDPFLQELQSLKLESKSPQKQEPLQKKYSQETEVSKVSIEVVEEIQEYKPQIVESNSFVPEKTELQLAMNSQ